MSGTVAHRLAEILREYGVEDIFGQSIPTQFFLAAEQGGTRQVFYRTENAGGAMADGFARTSHRLGVVTAQNGPAATLLVPPLAEAMKASVPVIAIVQEVPRSSRDRNAFQEYDHEALFASCVKWVRRLDSPDRLEDDVALALRIATSGRPGPVALLVPRDVLSAPVPAPRKRRRSVLTFPLDRPRPAAEQVVEAAALLAEARCPLVVAGGGVHVSRAELALAALQDDTALPVATTTMGKGAVAETHELSVGVIGSFMGPHSLTRSLRPWVEQADVVLFVGARTNENGTDAWRLFSDESTFIHLDLAPEEVGRNYESLRLVGDARAGLEDLRAAMLEHGVETRNRARSSVVDRLASAHEQDRKAADDVRLSEASPIRPERVAFELDALLPSEAIVVADASYSTIWAAAYLTAQRAGQRFISPRGLAGLGWGVPMALGAQIAAPSDPVICLVGDGGFGHTWQELETAVREELPITIVLFNNSILGYQKHGELAEIGQHTSAVEFAPVDHAAIARACGMEAHRIEDPAQLRPLLSQAIESRGPVLLEVITDPAAHPPITGWAGNAALAALAKA